MLVRLVAAVYVPLTFDEAYYWTWSKHLAGGYYDHPPMVAVVIRLGTLIAGDTPLGVRLVSILLALPMSYALFLATDSLFHDKRIAASATPPAAWLPARECISRTRTRARRKSRCSGFR